MRTSLLVAAACTLAAGCASVRKGTAARPEETPAALAKPEPDPACRGAVQGLLARNGLEVVTVKLSIAPGGRVEVVDFLSPDLTPAAQAELQRAMAGCVWAPVPKSEAEQVFTTTWIRELEPR